MNRNGRRHAACGLPILSAALVSAAGLLWDGAQSGAAAQDGTSGGVVVDYDALNTLSAQPTLPALPTPDGAGGNHVGMQPKPQAAPPPSAYARPKAVTPPGEPVPVPAAVPMLAPTPPPPGPGVSADLPVAAVPGAPESASMAAASPAVEAPASETPAPAPAAEAVAETQPAKMAQAETDQAEPAPVEPARVEPTPTEAASEQTPTPEASAGDDAPGAAEDASEEESSEEAAAEPAEPDNSQPAPPVPAGGIRIVYPTDMDAVPIEANAALDDLAEQMLIDESMRIQVKCYASGTGETESRARRRALARCLNIRQYLFGKDVRTTRMDVRALGLRSEGQPADRVDIVPADS